MKFLIEIKTKVEKDDETQKKWMAFFVQELRKAEENPKEVEEKTKEAEEKPKEEKKGKSKAKKDNFKIEDSFKRTSDGYQIHIEVDLVEAIDAILGFGTNSNVFITPCFSQEYKALDCEQLPQKVPESSCALKPKQPGGIKLVKEQETIAITTEMIANYREDVLERGTYANEAEAALMGEILGINFNIFKLITDTDLELALQVGDSSANFLLHRYNHYVVLIPDDGGPYKLKVKAEGGDIIKRFKEAPIKTRVDGSCLLDGAHIIKFGKNATNDEIDRYRKYLSKALPDEMIRQTLTTILIDVSRGLEVTGLGTRTSQLCENIPRNFLTPPKLLGIDHTLVCAVGSHALIKEASQHQGPIFIRIPAQKKKGKQKKDAKIKPIDPDELLKNFCNQSEGLKLQLLDGKLDQMGGYILFVNCECQKCIGTVLEIWIVEEDEFLIPIEEEFHALFGTEFTFTNEMLIKAPQAHVEKIKKENEDLEKKGLELNEVPDADALVKTNVNENAQKQWADKLVKSKVGIGVPEEVKIGEYLSQRIYYPDNWWYQVSLDVSCIELQTCPMTLAYAKRNEKQLQKDIFDLAHSLGIDPHEIAGGGHIHIGIRHSFRNNPLLFHNFFIDLCNHPFLLELLDNDPINAPVVAQYPIEKQQRFQEDLIAFYKKAGQKYKELESSSWNYADESLILEFVNLVRGSIYKYSFRENSTGLPSKYQALNLERVREKIPQQDWTIEIRSVRAQRSMGEFILIAALIEARINFLAKKLKSEFKSNYGLIQFMPQVRKLDKSNKDTIVSEIKKFVGETGLDPIPYLKLLDDNYPERDIKWSQSAAKVS